MKNDIDPIQTVSFRGILEPILSTKDKLKIEQAKEECFSKAVNAIKEYFNSNEEASKKMAALDLMNELNIPEKGFYVKQFINEYNK